AHRSHDKRRNYARLIREHIKINNREDRASIRKSSYWANIFFQAFFALFHYSKILLIVRRMLIVRICCVGKFGDGIRGGAERRGGALWRDTTPSALRADTPPRRGGENTVPEFRDSCVRPPALSTIWVLVGLPLTTKVPGDVRNRKAQRAPWE